jgi:hypothetical protein
MPVDGDAVRQEARVAGVALGQRDALVETEELAAVVGPGAVVLDDDRDVAHLTTEFGWQPVERLDHQLLEPLDLDGVHLFRVPAERAADVGGDWAS